jgi:hypothetical protein
MPYVRRNAEGCIVALLDAAEFQDQEFLPARDAQVLDFLGLPEAQFSSLDADFIRVVEDLIDVLIVSGVLRMTDLPGEAQRKLLARKDVRRKLTGALDLLDNSDVI